MPEPGHMGSRQENLHLYSRFESSSTPLPSLSLRSALHDSLHEVLNSGSRLCYAEVQCLCECGRCKCSSASPAVFYRSPVDGQAVPRQVPG